MEISTKYLGKVNIDESQIINFPKGILGFENHREFVLLDIEGNPLFKFLQNIKHEQIGFVLINPWEIFKDYDIELPDDKLENININPKDNNDMGIYNIVTLSNSLKKSTANLLAPIVINLKDKKGKQFVLNNSPYTTKHSLVKAGGPSC
jgi:flagellar assembly factor FliW